MTPVPKPKEMTQLLIEWGNGDRSALERLTPLVHDELRRLAHNYMRRERPDHTLQTSALVNEAYLRLVDQEGITFQNRAHFFAIAARAMRHILVEYARSRHRVKRGGGAQRVDLDEAMLVWDEPAAELVALDEALGELSEFDQRLGRVVELRYFGGLTVEETAAALGVHESTVVRDWGVARAWLRRRLREGGVE